MAQALLSLSASNLPNALIHERSLEIHPGTSISLMNATNLNDKLPRS